MKNIDLPEKLKELRLAHAYKQVDVASALGIVRQSYSHYERGDRTPDSEMLYKIAAFYNISVNDLMQHAVSLDPDIYYDSPPPAESGPYLDDFLEYLKKPKNQKRFKDFTNMERELIYYFEQIDNLDKWELVEFAKILSHKRSKKK